MSVSNGQDADQDTFNNAFMSRTADTSTAARIDLEDITNAASGATIANIQRSINGVHNFVGSAIEGAHDQDPTWTSDALTGTVAGESIKDRVDAVQSVVESNDANKVDKITGTDNALVKSDGTSGAIQDTGVIVDDLNNVTGINDLTIDGDLTVNGTTTTINTAVLEVEDANVIVNNGGDQATANTNKAGITVEMSDATDAVLGYDSSLASKFKCGESASEAEVLTASHTQAVTNKDIDGGTASNTNRITLPRNTASNLSGLTRKEGTIAYDNDKDKPVFDDGSNFVELASVDDIISTGGNNEPSMQVNVGLAASASAGALTVSLKQSDGSTDPSTGDAAVKIGYRSATATAAAYSVISTTSSLSVVIPSGAELGFGSGSDTFVHVYAINNSGSTELAVCGSKYFGDDEIVSTTAIGTGSDAGTTLYSTSARTNVPCRYLGFFRIDAMTTAGTWTTPDFASLFPSKNALSPLSTIITSRTETSSADAWTAATGGSLTLPPGRWRIGYDICLSVTENSVATNAVEGNSSLFVGGSINTNSLAYIYKTQAAGDYFATSASRQTSVELSTETTIGLRIRCGDAGAAGDCAVEPTSPTGSLSNPDNSSIVWAVPEDI